MAVLSLRFATPAFALTLPDLRIIAVNDLSLAKTSVFY